MQPLIEFKNVRKSNDDFELGPINLSFEPGTITALVGKNGAGKSTFFKLLMNLVSPTEGDIFIKGQSILGENEDWKKKISYQPQSLNGVNSFTGKELKKLVSHYYPTWDDDLFTKLVHQFELPLSKAFGKLSQGVQKQLSLALTIPRDTEILLLDEPTAHMDIPTKQILMDCLVDWMDRGDKMILIASHQVEDIRKLADYLVLFQKGKIVGNYVKEELVAQYKRYWLESSLSAQPLPGEIARKGERLIISNHPLETEAHLRKENQRWLDAESLDLEDIISIVLNNERKG
ncbi:ABC-2 type transport system ATP-binding protein [Mesobacillus persicus]|uniref:ABC-2 type transport system ATP-binding protein n=1 Tax=Mesobacillus persicus TaxID=930146 RepID=A0A1H8JXQ2_9BACI|nr:ABC transporter ATP-binding protein [Mesobacillus persicus]SEN85177.1 ABC-2 type transport system ATP-binding protein [Mesobacillus persicus]